MGTGCPSNERNWNLVMWSRFLFSWAGLSYLMGIISLINMQHLLSMRTFSDISCQPVAAPPPLPRAPILPQWHKKSHPVSYAAVLPCEPSLHAALSCIPGAWPCCLSTPAHIEVACFVDATRKVSRLYPRHPATDCGGRGVGTTG